MKVILTFSMPDSCCVSFVRTDYQGFYPFSFVKQLIGVDFPHYDFGTGLMAITEFIYRMDHVDWRPSRNEIHIDDINIRVEYTKPADFDVSVAYKECMEYTTCALVITQKGSFDYSSFVDKLQRLWDA